MKRNLRARIDLQMYLKYYLLVSVIFMFSACTVKDFRYLEKHQPKKNSITVISDQKYKKELQFQWKISKGDRIDIQAYNQSSNAANGQLTQLLSNGGQKSFTQKLGDEGILIPPNGVVHLPLIGAVNLLGLTEDKAAQLLMLKYKRYLKHPYVSVKILNQKLFVVGEVNRPGVVLVTNGTMNLFEALAKSGDLTDFANRKNITILRGDMRNPEVRKINLNDFNSLRYSSLILRPNDVVYVQPRESKANVVGVREYIPMWDLVGKILAPFTSSAVIYGVTQ
jgi:polysaccharide export outer membrane protein